MRARWKQSGEMGPGKQTFIINQVNIQRKGQKQENMTQEHQHETKKEILTENAKVNPHLTTDYVQPFENSAPS